MKLARFVLSVLTCAMFGSASAVVVVSSGVDVGANSGDPRPNSNAAAAAFDLSNNETIINFEAAPLGSFTNLVIAPGVTINGTDFGGSPQTILNSPVGSPDGLFGYNTTFGGSQWLSLFGGSITFTFATPIEDFGAYFSGVQLTGETITFNDGAPQSIALPNPGSGVFFLGFTDFGNPITSLTINVQVGGTGDIIGIDDVRYSVAQGPQVPEPATLALAGLALAGLGFSRRKR